MKFRVEFGFADNVMLVDEWQTIDELAVVEADNYKVTTRKPLKLEQILKGWKRLFSAKQKEKKNEKKY